MVIATASAAAHAAGLEPTGKWVVDYATTKCSASRTYGTDKEPIYLGLVPSPSGQVLRLMVAHPGSARVAHHVPLDLTFSGRQVRTTGLRFGGEERKRELVWITLDRFKLDGLDGTAELKVAGTGIDETFAVPGIKAVLKALDKCGEDLRNYWNMAEGTVAVPAMPIKPLREYFSYTDYPQQAIDEDLGGQTIFTMLIDETGALKDCMLEKASGIASIDAMGCQVLRERAKFTPAMDREGRAIRSISVTPPITWRIVK